jgi:hypothetical protein
MNSWVETPLIKWLVFSPNFPGYNLPGAACMTSAIRGTALARLLFDHSVAQTAFYRFHPSAAFNGIICTMSAQTTKKVDGFHNLIYEMIFQSCIPISL